MTARTQGVADWLILCHVEIAALDRSGAQWVTQPGFRFRSPESPDLWVQPNRAYGRTPCWRTDCHGGWRRASSPSLSGRSLHCAGLPGRRRSTCRLIRAVLVHVTILLMAASWGRSPESSPATAPVTSPARDFDRCANGRAGPFCPWVPASGKRYFARPAPPNSLAGSRGLKQRPDRWLRCIPPGWLRRRRFGEAGCRCPWGALGSRCRRVPGCTAGRGRRCSRPGTAARSPRPKCRAVTT